MKEIFFAVIYFTYRTSENFMVDFTHLVVKGKFLCNALVFRGLKTSYKENMKRTKKIWE